jgi:hypothetical protein
MVTICCTRFNNITWNENEIWRENNEFNGCIYNTPKKIKDNILPDVLTFVLEMNNDKNIIMGVGFIKNHIHNDKYYDVYREKNYNRYTYKSTYRIDRNNFTKKEMRYIEILEILLFKGSRHVKRGYGIQQIPSWILNNNAFDFSLFLKNMFKRRFNTVTEKKAL